jgi:hypothetical protein
MQIKCIFSPPKGKEIFAGSIKYSWRCIQRVKGRENRFKWPGEYISRREIRKKEEGEKKEKCAWNFKQEKGKRQVGWTRKASIGGQQGSFSNHGHSPVRDIYASERGTFYYHY